MPKQDDDIFEFDPTSFWKELPEKETAQGLSDDSKLLNWVESQLAFHLKEFYKEFYKRLIKIYLKNIQEELKPELLSFTPILEQKVDLAKAEGSLDKTKIDQVLKDLEQDSEITKILNKVTKKLQIYRVISALEKTFIDFGEEGINDKNAEDSFKTFCKYIHEEKSADLKDKISLILQNISQDFVLDIDDSLDLSDFTLTDLDRILGFKQNNKDESVPVTESRLTNAILPIPSFAAFKSAITAQIRKDLWGKDNNGFAYFKHQSQGYPKNYIEHYISSPGDITVLPWEQAEQIIDKFGFNTVKLHLIFAAHTMNQPIPWSGKFSLKASDVIKYLGWDKRTDLPVHQKLSEIAKAAFVLDCLLVKSVWVEGRNKKGGINASTPTGRMWNVVVDPRGQLNIDGKVEKPKEVYITVQPGLIFHSFLNKAGSKLKEALYQFGYLAQDILRIDPYHQELALRLAIHLAMDSRIHTSGKYRVETLLKHLLPHTVIDKARQDRHKGYDLKQRWDNALKLLKKLKWQIQFDESYPEWLQPGSKAKKPSDSRKMKIIEWLLQAKITIKPPEPIPEMLAAKVKPKPKTQKLLPAKATRLTSDQIRKARNAKGWSQRKLAGWLGVTQTLVGYWEKGKRTPSEEMETKLRQLLEIDD